MKKIFETSQLKDLIAKVEAGVRLNREDGIRLINSQDILAIGYMADMVRRLKHGDRTYFVARDPQAIEGEMEPNGHPEAETNVAVLVYGQGEKIETRVDQLIQIRETQDQVGNLIAFAPIAAHAGNSKAVESLLSKTTGFDDLKMLAISRIMLDNIDHIKAFWMLIGTKLAQVSLSFGVDDLDGAFNQSLAKDNLIAMIKAAGRIPVERDAIYNVIGKDFS